MIYLNLFWTFFKIGLFTFGGGYAMIPLIQSEVVSMGWLTEGEVLDFIAISESTPGPLAINMATFVGTSQAGFFGAVCTTLGVVLPSFIVILIIASLFKNIQQNKWYKGAVAGVVPFVSALIVSTGVLLFIKNIYTNFGSFKETPTINIYAIIISAVVIAICVCYKKVKKKQLTAIPIIVVSAVLGMILM